MRRLLTLKRLRGLFLASALLLTGALGFLGLLSPKGAEVGERLTPSTVLQHSQMNEVSGLVAASGSREFLWAHNDSGNEPRLFAITPEGSLAVPLGVQQEEYGGIDVVGSTLVDWETIARDGDRLYICDLGNNLNARKHLGVYEVIEPEPYRDLEVQVSRYFEVKYPDQNSFPPTGDWRFDCEASFCRDGKLYILTKERPAFRIFVQRDSTRCYALDLTGAQGVNELELVDTLSGLGGWVTAADIDSAGKRVAILCESPQQSIWLFELGTGEMGFLSNSPTVKRYLFQGGGQLESLAFLETSSGEELFMVNEGREVFRIPMSKFEVVDGPTG